jgi:hypothetical protein
VFRAPSIHPTFALSSRWPLNTSRHTRRTRQTVRQDLALAQRPDYRGVTPEEICEWTGVRTNCFVNFVPEVEHVWRSGDGDGGKVRLVPYPYKSRKKLWGRGKSSLRLYWSLEPTRELHWCGPSVDVEAKLEVGGSLTPGSVCT